nr:hypothetical protein [Physocyclus mexicanus]
MLRLVTSTSLVLTLCYFAIHSQAAAVGTADQHHSSIGESPATNENPDAVVPLDVALRFIFYTLDPIGGGNLVSELNDFLVTEEGRDLGEMLNIIVSVISRYEEKYPSVADKIRRALEALLLVGPIHFPDSEDPSAREENDEQVSENILPVESVIDAAIEAFQTNLVDCLVFRDSLRIF